jgi:AcrR family transcriptional regulator
MPLDERRAQLLELGMALFAERPYDEVAVDDIAGAAGVSKGLLYHYFGGKRDFYLACVRQTADTLLLAVDPRSEPPGPQRIVKALRAYFDFVSERPRAYLALLSGGMGVDESVVAVVNTTRDAIVGQILDAIGLAEPRPVFRMAARTWVGSVETACQDWIAHRDVDKETMVDLLVTNLVVSLHKATRLDPESGVLIPDAILAAVLPQRSE